MNHAERTIADLEARLEKLDAESHKIKSAINCLCDVMDKPPKYELDEKPEQMGGQRPDEYYGRPLATVVTEVLEQRRQAGYGSASLDEIYVQLIAGGFAFTGKSDGIKKRGLAIAMSKNRKFHKIKSNKTWGLAEWYPEVKEAKETNNNEAFIQPQAEIEEEEPDSPETADVAEDDWTEDEQ